MSILLMVEVIELFGDGVAREEIGRGFGVRYGVVYECDEATPT